MILKSTKDALELKFSLLALAATLRTVTDNRTYKAQSQICNSFLNLTRFIKLKFDKIARHFTKGEKMKNLVLAAIAALFFAGCAANKPAPAEQNAQEYRHATQIKDASCPHHGMANASCAQAHGAMKECPHHGNHGVDKSLGCSGESDKSKPCPKCDAKAQGCAQHKECTHHGKSGASDKAHACPHHKH